MLVEEAPARDGELAMVRIMVCPNHWMVQSFSKGLVTVCKYFGFILYV